jgi:hypothetical protein
MRTVFYKIVSVLFLLASFGVAVGTNYFDQLFAKELNSFPPIAWTPDKTSSGANNSVTPPVASVVSDLSSTFARPLLSQSRKPFVLQVAATPEQIDEPPPTLEPEPPPLTSIEGFRLMGSFNNGALVKALIATPSQPAGQWVGPLDTLEGLVVKKIGDNTVLLEQRGQHVTLQQYVDKQN